MLTSLGLFLLALIAVGHGLLWMLYSSLRLLHRHQQLPVTTAFKQIASEYGVTFEPCDRGYACNAMTVSWKPKGGVFIVVSNLTRLF